MIYKLKKDEFKKQLKEQIEFLLNSIDYHRLFIWINEYIIINWQKGENACRINSNI